MTRPRSCRALSNWMTRPERVHAHVLVTRKFVDVKFGVCVFLFRLDSLQQTKARLELSNQTQKQQHNKELEGREEELEQVKITLNKKLKALNLQLEEAHEERTAAIKVHYLEL